MAVERAVARVKTTSSDSYHKQIGYKNKIETCILYPSVPKAWLANGFMIVPSLSEKGESLFVRCILTVIELNR